MEGEGSGVDDSDSRASGLSLQTRSSWLLQQPVTAGEGTSFPRITMVPIELTKWSLPPKAGNLGSSMLTMGSHALHQGLSFSICKRVRSHYF